MGNETTLVICFGIITIIATVAGLHYRDSLCCLMCRSLVGAWSTTDTDRDIEAVAGLQTTSRHRSQDEDGSSIELEPRRTLPLYFDSTAMGRYSHDDEASIEASVPAAQRIQTI